MPAKLSPFLERMAMKPAEMNRLFRRGVWSMRAPEQEVLKRKSVTATIREAKGIKTLRRGRY